MVAEGTVRWVSQFRSWRRLGRSTGWGTVPGAGVTAAPPEEGLSPAGVREPIASAAASHRPRRPGRAARSARPARPAPPPARSWPPRCRRSTAVAMTMSAFSERPRMSHGRTSAAPAQIAASSRAPELSGGCDHVAGRDPERAVEARPRRRVRRRAEDERPLEQRLGQHEPPRAERAERHAGAPPRRRPASAGYAPASPSSPSAGAAPAATTSARRRAAAAVRPEASAATSSAAPGPLGGPSTSSSGTPTAATSQPSRGSSATSAAVIAAARAAARRVGREPAERRPRPARRRRRAPPAGRGGRQRREPPLERVRRDRRPPSSDTSPSASASASNRSSSVPRSLRVRPHRAVQRRAQVAREVGAAPASGGSTVPIRRAVAVGEPAATGFSPASASYRTSPSA